MLKLTRASLAIAVLDFNLKNENISKNPNTKVMVQKRDLNIDLLVLVPKILKDSFSEIA
jgi:hypothetical protein